MVMPAGGRLAKLHSPSSITTTESAAAGQPSSRRRRPVVTTKGAPMSLTGIAWAAVSTCIEVMPGMTVIFGAGVSLDAMRRVLS